MQCSKNFKLKNTMKRFSLIIFLAAIISCNSGNDKNMKASNDLISYVDSFKQVVDVFHNSGDTSYVRYIIDPNGDPEDFMNQRLDTVVDMNTKRNYFSGRKFGGIDIKDDLLENTKIEYGQKLKAVDRTKLSGDQVKKVEEAEKVFEQITTEYLAK